MIVNNPMTHYHKTIDTNTRLEKWIRINYGTKNNPTIWAHGGLGARFNKGFSEANDLQVRIPYSLNPETDINTFEIDDIIIIDEITDDIQTEADLIQYEVYKIRSITDNKFGNNPHVHLGCM